MAKRRAPAKQLQEVKELGDRLLKERGLRTKESAIETIRETKGGPRLPGFQDRIPYLPQPTLINASKRVLYDLAREWELEAKKEKVKSEDITQFFKFILKGIREEGGKVRMLIADTVAKKEYNLEYLHRQDAVAAIHKFLVDSFAVGVSLKMSGSVSEFLTWFVDWTDSLLQQWGPNYRNIDGKPSDDRTTKKIYTGSR